MTYNSDLQGMLRYGIIPRILILEDLSSVKVFSTHSNSSIENSLSASITISMRLGSSIDPGVSSNTTFSAGCVLLMGKQFGIIVISIRSMHDHLLKGLSNNSCESPSSKKKIKENVGAMY